MELKEFHAIKRDDGLFDISIKYYDELHSLKHKMKHVTKIEDDMNLKGVYLSDICTYVPDKDRNITPLYFIVNYLSDIFNEEYNLASQQMEN